jgi:hypothetical protein
MRTSRLAWAALCIGVVVAFNFGMWRLREAGRTGSSTEAARGRTARGSGATYAPVPADPGLPTTPNAAVAADGRARPDAEAVPRATDLLLPADLLQMRDAEKRAAAAVAWAGLLTADREGGYLRQRLEALLELEGAPLEPALLAAVSALADDPRVSVAAAALRVLAATGSADVDAERVRGALRRSKDGEDHGLVLLLVRLERRNLTDASSELVAATLASGSASGRRALLTSLPPGYTGGPVLISQLIALTADADTRVASDAVRHGLGGLATKPPAVVDRLLELAVAGPPDVQVAARTALRTELPAAEQRKVLRIAADTLRKDADRETWRWALRVLEEAGGAAEAELLERLSDDWRLAADLRARARAVSASLRASR